MKLTPKLPQSESEPAKRVAGRPESQRASTLERGIAYLHHLARALPHLDVKTIYWLFVVRRSSNQPLSSKLKGASGRFWFRGFADRGVMSHFYEPGYDIYQQGPESIANILDLGANIGDETVKFAIRHPNARIIAIEPSLKNFNFLVKNIAPYGPRISAVHAGIWHRDTRLDVIEGENPEVATVRENPDGGVLARSIPSLMREFGWKQVDILKVDIEGSEYELFSIDSENWLPAVKAIVIEISDHERPGAFQAFFHALARSGFHGDCYISGENIVAIRRGTGLRLRERTGLS